MRAALVRSVFLGDGKVKEEWHKAYYRYFADILDKGKIPIVDEVCDGAEEHLLLGEGDSRTIDTVLLDQSHPGLSRSELGAKGLIGPYREHLAKSRYEGGVFLGAGVSDFCVDHWRVGGDGEIESLLSRRYYARDTGDLAVNSLRVYLDRDGSAVGLGAAQALALVIREGSRVPDRRSVQVLDLRTMAKPRLVDIVNEYMGMS